MDDAKLRAWWSHRQGLDGSLNGMSPSEVLQQAGWARSVGGAGPYLGLHARAGIGRQEVDEAVLKLEIHELPSARGCTYVLPSSDFPLALTVGRGFGNEAEMNTARKLGVTDAEIEKLCSVIVKVLGKGPLEPDALREASGGAVRNLGEEGKKKGLTTTLPLALGKLQLAGEIRRVPTNGRLDQQRYRYTLWRPNPLEKSGLTREEAFVELARRYFKWIGPATLAEFQWFSGLGVREARVAVESLKLVALESGSDRLMFARDRETLLAFQPPKKPQYALTSSLDSLVLLRRDLRSLVAAEDLQRRVFCEKEYKEIGRLSDLYDHAVFDRGRLVGLWAFDLESNSVAWVSFGIKDKSLDEAVARTEKYVRSDLGDARSFSLDSPKSRSPRIAALRKAALV